MSEHTSTGHDATSEPGGADEVAAAHGDGASADTAGMGDEGVAIGLGEPSSFEPEEDTAPLPDEQG
ncbi:MULTISPECIES: hypothetical protein [unclassified Actinotalea]|uniref:hypothetical protein n=1 Tax=unclassified Actinotalea TaxID=2638618 RepID=UPI0015F57D23|nr:MULTISPECIES: hypothetical protein [unclassified Actinotalea]